MMRSVSHSPGSLLLLPAAEAGWRGPTTVPLGKQIIISTGKLYFSRCRPASFWWDGFSWLFCRDSWVCSCCLGSTVPGAPMGALPTHLLLTCRSSSSFTRDQVLMKLSLRRARMGELSRTVSRRVRPEPVQV